MFDFTKSIPLIPNIDEYEAGQADAVLNGLNSPHLSLELEVIIAKFDDVFFTNRLLELSEQHRIMTESLRQFLEQEIQNAKKNCVVNVQGLTFEQEEAKKEVLLAKTIDDLKAKYDSNLESLDEQYKQVISACNERINEALRKIPQP